MKRKNRVASTDFQGKDGFWYVKDDLADYYARLASFRQANEDWLPRYRRSLERATLELQGQVVKLKITRHPGTQTGGGVRQKITEFSSKSQNAMRERMARLDWSKRVAFVTLTYASDVSHSDAKRHLRAFLKRLRRKHPKKRISFVWRMEYQQRGTIHWHILCFGLPFTAWREVKSDWIEITGDDAIKMVRIELIHDHKKARAYVAKYMAKAPGTDGGIPFLDTLTNQAALGTPGRFWGMEGRAFLPFAELIQVSVTDLWDAVYQFKRYMRRRWPMISKHQRSGGTLFVDNTSKWLEAWRSCILSGERCVTSRLMRLIAAYKRKHHLSTLDPLTLVTLREYSKTRIVTY